MKRSPAAVLDASAVVLSTLCLIHCLALPLLAALLPLFGAWAHDEWVHVVFAGVALPLSGLALWRAHRQAPLPAAMWLMATAGLGGLVLGAAGWPSHDWETPVTVGGSLLLVATHLWNWSRRPHC
ncbi:hypothetical protein CSC70_02320 [Pseudoxanthomonas kalamensis DSM 18571]|uniref:MerC domain-containing protein n=1 Tax=Pseudoxanthomonas kalamensis TaxID=289483 RepID=UPI00139201ED|nr:MerC domain-containing protein [Pseudoxanthomonas kalamensis]KAF1712378.1 hypothetical protein CSC70_02320 [Pseudoxanthomonas kalamensis DSM 18571]